MRFPGMILLSILLCPSLAQDTSVEERKSNMVVKILNKVLTDVAELTTKNLTIPRLDFGDLGWMENVTVSIPRITNATDGVGSFGFKMEVNVSDVLATGYYNVKDVDVPGLFPVCGDGYFDVFVSAVNVKLKIAATKIYDKDKFEFSIQTFTFEVAGSKVHFENLMGDPHVSDFLNELLGNLMPSLAQSFREPLLKILDRLVDYYGNGVVSCIQHQLLDLENCIRDLFDTVAGDSLCRLPSAFPSPALRTLPNRERERADKRPLQSL